MMRGMNVTAQILIALIATAAPLAAVADDLSEVFRHVSPSVVVVETVQSEILPDDPGLPVSVGGLGSGVLISNDGKVMTAAHVVQTADSVTVVFGSGERIDARVLASEPRADVALLQLERMPQVARIATIGDSDAMQVGDPVFVVGAPYGIDHTLTAGHISGRRRPDAGLGGFGLAEFFQTDAAINQGNSGGPMFNLDGEVIGIVSHILTMSGGSQGLGFAVTSNMARELLIEQRSIWSGMDGHLLRGEMAKLFHVPQPAGILVQKVAKGSIAAHLGLRPGSVPATIGDEFMLVGGDVILEVQGIPIEGGNDTYEKIRARMQELKDRDKIVIKVLRGGQVVELSNFFFPDLFVPPPVREVRERSGS